LRENEDEDQEHRPLTFEYSSKQKLRQPSDFSRRSFVTARRINREKSPEYVGEGDAPPVRIIEEAGINQDWKSTSRSKRRAVAALTESGRASVFRLPKLPDSISYIADGLQSSKAFKSCKQRLEAAGAHAHADLRAYEIAETSAQSLIDSIPTSLQDLSDRFEEISPGDTAKAFDIWRKSLVKTVRDMSQDVCDVVRQGVTIAAGTFNEEVVVYRSLVTNGDGKKISKTLESLLPSATFLFDDQGTKIKDALEARFKNSDLDLVKALVDRRPKAPFKNFSNQRKAPYFRPKQQKSPPPASKDKFQGNSKARPPFNKGKGGRYFKK
jgi:hypothetical protein